MPRFIALVVDDDPNSLLLVSEALETVSITSITARDGASALNLAVRMRPDIILLDAMMPGLDGFSTCRALKTMPEISSVPVMFMTCLNEHEYILEGLNAGGVDYVSKPVNIEVLLARVNIHLINSMRLLSARAALDSAGRMVVAFNHDGVLTWASTPGREMIERLPSDWISPTLQAQGELLAWLNQAAKMPNSHSIDLRCGPLELRHVGRSGVAEEFVSLTDRSEPSRAHILAKRFKLTERESEVLFWLTQGKSNTDIGYILGLSSRTVSKHLEQVFEKMGVDNRTSAAVMADRIAHR